MLHADRFDGPRGSSCASSDKKETPPNYPQPGMSDAEELDALLKSNLSPNKRAVVEALLNTWETSQQGVQLKQTG